MQLPGNVPVAGQQREFKGCQPEALQVQGISLAAFQRVMQRLFPDIPSCLAECLYQAVARRETIDANEVLDGYFNEQSIEIRQDSKYILGGGQFFPLEHKLAVLRIEEDELLPLELTLPTAGAPGVNMRLIVSELDEETQWARINEVGKTLGRPNLSELFLKASPEQRSLLPSGLVATTLTPSISLQSLVADTPTNNVATVEPDRIKWGDWVPRCVQCANLLYSERNEILSIVLPQQAKQIIESGVMNTAENFAENHSLLAQERLMRIAQKLPFPIQVDFRRWVGLGEPAIEAEALEPDEDRETSNDAPSKLAEHAEGVMSNEQDGEESFSEWEEPEFVWNTEESDEASTTGEFDEGDGDLDRDAMIESSVVIRGISSALGECKLVCCTHAEAHGATLLADDRSFDMRAHTLGIEFEDETQGPAKHAAQNRWRLLKRLGNLLDTPIETASIQRDLAYFNSEPDSCSHGIDLLSGRLAIFLRK